MATEQVYVKVHFLDNSYKTFLIPPETKASDFTFQVAEKLGFQNPMEDGYWFGLWESRTGSGLDRPLGKNDEIGNMVKGWGADAPNKIVFLIKLYYDALITCTDDSVQYYRFVRQGLPTAPDAPSAPPLTRDRPAWPCRYIQAVHAVVTNQYPVEDAMAVQLAALQFRAKFGDEVDFSTDFLGGRIVEFIPGRLLQKSRAGRGGRWGPVRFG
jgi:hypothetical protein